MAATPTDIVNQAIQLIGANQMPVTGNVPNFDTSAAGVAARYLYQAAVDTVARQFGWDFNRNTVALVLSGNTAPAPWSVEYIYPTNGVQVRQVMPITIADLNNPVPLDWIVANAVVNGAQSRVIQANLPDLQAVYTNRPGPDVWDASFRESVVRLLASEMAMAIGGRPDTASKTLEQYAEFEQIGEGRDS